MYLIPVPFHFRRGTVSDPVAVGHGLRIVDQESRGPRAAGHLEDEVGELGIELLEGLRDLQATGACRRAP